MGLHGFTLKLHLCLVTRGKQHSDTLHTVVLDALNVRLAVLLGEAALVENSHLLENRTLAALAGTQQHDVELLCRFSLCRLRVSWGRSAGLDLSRIKFGLSRLAERCTQVDSG